MVYFSLGLLSLKLLEQIKLTVILLELWSAQVKFITTSCIVVTKELADVSEPASWTRSKLSITIFYEVFGDAIEKRDFGFQKVFLWKMTHFSHKNRLRP